MPQILASAVNVSFNNLLMSALRGSGNTVTVNGTQIFSNKVGQSGNVTAPSVAAQKPFLPSMLLPVSSNSELLASSTTAVQPGGEVSSKTVNAKEEPGITSTDSPVAMEQGPSTRSVSTVTQSGGRSVTVPVSREGGGTNGESGSIKNETGATAVDGDVKSKGDAAADDDDDFKPPKKRFRQPVVVKNPVSV